MTTLFGKGGVLSVRDSLEHTLRVSAAATVTKATTDSSSSGRPVAECTKLFMVVANTTRPSGC